MNELKNLALIIDGINQSDLEALFFSFQDTELENLFLFVNESEIENGSLSFLDNFSENGANIHIHPANRAREDFLAKFKMALFKAKQSDKAHKAKNMHLTNTIQKQAPKMNRHLTKSWQI